MNSESEIIYKLIESIIKQLESNDVGSSCSKIHNHPKFGQLIFTMNTKVIDDLDFPPNTISLNFSINRCSSIIGIGSIEKVLADARVYLSDNSILVHDLNTYYRVLFEGHERF